MNRERGSATIVVMTFLAILLAIVIANAVAMHQLGKELRLVDKQQQKKFQSNQP
jgi:type II secretory pathway component PulK